MKPRLLLIPGLVAFPLFMTAASFESQLRSDYDPILYPLSSLAMGEKGWMQISNFILTGILLFIFSMALRKFFDPVASRFHGPVLLSLAGLGLIGAGICVTDPVYGYPPDQPLLLKQVTVHGYLHDAFSMLVFVCLPWACILFGKRFRKEEYKKMAFYSFFTAILMVSFFILCSLGFKQVYPVVNYAGLFQRLSIASGGLWISILALHSLQVLQGRGMKKKLPES